jgi:methionine synthase I (cobalamin-dependent)
LTADPSAGLPRPRFRQRLTTRPLLVDGGLGTLLFSRGVPQRACLEELVISQPDLVSAAHREYLEAGAELSRPCRSARTDGGSRRGLEGRGRRALSRRAGASSPRAAREVSGRDALIGGSVGPLGPAARGGAALPEADVRAAFREQIDGLLEGGVDAIVLETFSDLPSLLVAVDAARRASDLPVIASLTFGEERVLVDGSRPEEAAAALDGPAPTWSASTAEPARRRAWTPWRRWARRPTTIRLA